VSFLVAFSLGGGDFSGLSSSEAAFLVCDFDFDFAVSSFCGLAIGSLRADEALERVECAFGMFVDDLNAVIVVV
jgi:hypothetical protein